MINFGDIFIHREKEYVFLAKTEEIIYVAQILNSQETEKINRLSEIRAKSLKERKYKDHILYCIVILQTKDFKNRIVFLGKTGKDDLGYVFDEIICTLDNRDQVEIKNEILRPGSPVPLELKELIKQLDI